MAEQRVASQPSTSLINDPKFRSIFTQIVVLALVALCVYILWSNAYANLQRQNIASGFGFLGQSANFAINQTLINYNPSNTYGRVFWVGFLNTILVAIVGIVLATMLGFVIGVARLSSNWIIAKLATVYVETIRNIPLLLQIFFWYFAVLRALPPRPADALNIFGVAFLNLRGLVIPAPIAGEGLIYVGLALILAIVAAIGINRWAKKRQMATGKIFPTLRVNLAIIIGLPLIVFLILGAPLSFEFPELGNFNFRGGVTVYPEFLALLLALTIYTAAFIAEIVRAGILAVSHGQSEAAFALGLRPNRALKLVIVPQALRVIIPPLTSQYLNLTKNSSLAVAIGYPDFFSVFGGTTLNQTGQAIEVIAITASVYLLLSLITSIIMNIYNSRMALVER